MVLDFNSCLLACSLPPLHELEPSRPTPVSEPLVLVFPRFFLIAAWLSLYFSSFAQIYLWEDGGIENFTCPTLPSPFFDFFLSLALFTLCTYFLFISLVYYLSPALECKFCIGRVSRSAGTQKVFNKYFLDEWMAVKHHYTVHIYLYNFLTSGIMLNMWSPTFFFKPSKESWTFVHVNTSGWSSFF